MLILTASYGSGHNAAAGALETAFQRAGVSTRVVDHFRELVHPRFERWTRAVYDCVTCHARPLWRAAYWLGDRPAPSSPLVFGMGTLGAHRLDRLLRHERPDHVVSTHPTPAGAFCHLRALGRTDIPHTLVFTDFAVHSQWVHPTVDQVCVPAVAIRHQVVARGVPRDRVRVTGIPLRPEFSLPVERAAARQALGLSLRLPVVLVMAGALSGMGRLVAATRVIRDLPFPVQAVVVAGRDHRLAARLRAIAAGAGGRVQVIGYSDSVRALMAAADLFVSKAGGVSIAEALAAELPMVCFGSLPGHEARNEAFLVSAGAAVRAGSAADLDRILRLALTDPGFLTDLKEQIRELRQPDAAQAILAFTLHGGLDRPQLGPHGWRHPGR